MELINLDSNGISETKAFLNSINSLQCNYNLEIYIITYLSENKKQFNFEIYSSPSNLKYSYNSQINDSIFVSSSCLLLDITLTLCINSLEREMKYYYLRLSGTNAVIIKEDIIDLDYFNGKSYLIKGEIIKYYSISEILMCINANVIDPKEDINLICNMINAGPSGNNLNFEIKASFLANEKVSDDINYCQIEKLTSSDSNLYASICLSFYYRTKYLLSIFKYSNNVFSLYNTDYQDLSFSLLGKTPISIIPFREEIFGIFFKDIDNDAMILMCYPKCSPNPFDHIPKYDESSICFSSDTHDYYYDECTHSYKTIPEKYEEFETNQLCQIKKITCKSDYVLDTKFGTYECWNRSNPPNNYFYSSENIFKKCHHTCLKCNGENSNQCLECKKDFYEIEDNDSSVNNKKCHHKNDPLEGYYIDNSLPNPKFKKCGEECLTCTTNTQCLKCNIQGNYYPQVDNPSKCIPNDSTNIRHYYASDDYKSWEKCFDGCEYCIELGTSIYDTKCKEIGSIMCSEGYFKVEGSNSNCFKKDTRYDHFYENKDDQIFKKCDDSCLQCDQSSTSDNTNCLPNKCDELHHYYPKEDNPTLCYKYEESSSSSVNPQGYYFDKNTKKFRRCHIGCLKCIIQLNPNENDTQCFTCDNNMNFYQLDSETGNCYSKNRNGYYFDYDHSIIRKCPEGCSSCEIDTNDNNNLKCTKCDNTLRFYELEVRDASGNTINPKYKDCRTLRIEKILDNPTNYPYNQAPDENRILSNHTFIENGESIIIQMFKFCSAACSSCTDIHESKYKTHCQAKKCNLNYIYILNHEDICIKKDEPLLYYFNYEGKYFKPCFETCETCQGSGTKQNNKCLTCREGYKKHPNSNTKPNNCIFDCLSIHNYFYLDEENNEEYTCVDKCPENYPFLQPDKKQCLKTCKNEDILKYSRDRICVSQCQSNTKSNSFLECVSVSNNCIKSELESNYILQDINDSNINDYIINYCHDYSYTSNQITVVSNKLNQYQFFIYKNKDCITEFFGNNLNFPDLSVCFNELKNLSNINQNNDLIIMIMNIYNKDSSIQVEYKIFNSITCQELELDKCSIKKISTNINLNTHFSEPEIEEAKKMYDKGIIVYDRESPFFTDICYEYTSENGKDMILEDRVDEFYQNVDNICENNCKMDADFENKILKCICNLKTKFLEKSDDENEKDLGYGVKSISIQVIKCAKKAFLWDYFKDNIGSYSSLAFIVAEIPIIFIFIKNGLSQVKIFLIHFMGTNPPKRPLNNGLTNENNDNKNKEDENRFELNKSKDIINDNNLNDEINNIINNNNYSNLEDINNKDKQSIKEEIIYENIQKNSNDKISNNSLFQNQNDSERKQIKRKNYDIYKNIIDYDDINDIELFDAIIFDKRNFCQFYWDELKRTQPIIYSFIVYTPLTPRFFKILLFIFNAILCFVFNALFYSKSYISKKYYYFGNTFSWYVNHIYDRIIYVCICSIFLNLFIRVLLSSKKKMQMWIKRERDPEKFNKDITYMANKMKINYIIFMTVQGFLMFFFWLYLSCFCNCYKNNQLEWFVTSLICFGIIQIWYFVSTFIVSSLRLIGIRLKIESCYNVSLCLSYD